MLARRFLWVIAICIIIVIAGLIGYWLFGTQLIRAALTPSVPFSAADAGPAPDYRQPAAWAARPGADGGFGADDPSRWTPAGFRPAPRPPVAVFFVPPTTNFARDRWNAPITDKDMAEQGAKFVRAQSSLFNGIGAVWAPRYRQASFGSFLTDKPEAAQAQALAYTDVRAAFRAFLEAQPADRPLVLAGHSQGSLHLYRLLAEEIAGTPVAARILAVYAPGWPLSVTADLPAMGLPACTDEAMPGCLMSWQSFADPADPAPIIETFEAGTGYTGQPRRGTAMLCSNPLSGRTGSEGVAEAANLGSLVPDPKLEGGSIVPRGLGARCLPSGILDIGPPPAGFSAFILPGNNYHVYDFSLFWANIRADSERRLASWLAASGAGNSGAGGKPLPPDPA